MERLQERSEEHAQDLEQLKTQVRCTRFLSSTTHVLATTLSLSLTTLTQLICGLVVGFRGLQHKPAVTECQFCDHTVVGHSMQCITIYKINYLLCIVTVQTEVPCGCPQNNMESLGARTPWFKRTFIALWRRAVSHIAVGPHPQTNTCSEQQQALSNTARLQLGHMSSLCVPASDGTSQVGTHSLGSCDPCCLTVAFTLFSSSTWALDTLAALGARSALFPPSTHTVPLASKQQCHGPHRPALATCSPPPSPSSSLEEIPP